MASWKSVGRHPLRLCAFALAGVFGLVAEFGPTGRYPWLAPAAVGMACAALLIVLLITLRKMSRTTHKSQTSRSGESNSASSPILQNTRGDQSPAISHVEGSVYIDYSVGELHAHFDGRHIDTSKLPVTSRLAAPDSSVPVVSIEERGPRSWGRTVAVAAMLVLMAIGVIVWHSVEGTTYSTEAGEWRRIRLEDGSVVFLKEQSEIRVSFSSARRTIDLLRGEAVFDVAHDARRPLSVRSPAAEVQALGTRFDVDYRVGLTRVTVVGGSVRVKDSRGQSLVLTEEEGAEITGEKIIRSDSLQVESIVAAQRDEVVFDRQRLSVVAERFNLDNRRQLRIGDAAAGQKTIGGRYKTDHPEKLVLAIRELYPQLRVQETEDGWVVR